MKILARFVNRILSIFGVRLIWLNKASNTNLPFQFQQDSNYSLVLVGGHNGSKTTELVGNALQYGKVCLVEPIPYLFDELTTLYNDTPQVRLLNVAITLNEVEFVDFYAPTREANKVQDYGDQLGSLSSGHAIDHDSNFEPHIKKIRVRAFTISRLLTELGCTDIDLLFLDTEGFDAQILKCFPFDVLKPNKIIFEHMHSDGTHQIGKNFASVVTLLDSLGYAIRILNNENVYARQKKTHNV